MLFITTDFTSPCFTYESLTQYYVTLYSTPSTLKSTNYCAGKIFLLLYSASSRSSSVIYRLIGIKAYLQHNNVHMAKSLDYRHGSVVTPCGLFGLTGDFGNWMIFNIQICQLITQKIVKKKNLFFFLLFLAR